MSTKEEWCQRKKKERMMEVRDHVSVLVHLSRQSGSRIEEKRKVYLRSIAGAKGLGEEEVNYLMEYPDPMPSLTHLLDEEKFECLFTSVQFMKHARKVSRKEIVFCKKIAVEMGYSPQIIYEISAFIYSDPSVSVNHEFLRNLTFVYSITK